METTKERAISARMPKVASYTNRKGHQYFAHQGVTKTGKPKYFASQRSEGAISKLPSGFAFGESINGVVTIQRPKSCLIRQEDLDLVKRAMSEHRHLKHYRVEAKDKSILIYEPMGMDSIDTLSKLGSHSMFDNLKRMFGDKFDDALEKTAIGMGLTPKELKRVDRLAAEERKKRSVEHMLRNIQYDAVMRFTLDRICGPYQVERRCYRGEEPWASLGFGSLDRMLKKYVRHIGKESFFDLM